MIDLAPQPSDTRLIQASPAIASLRPVKLEAVLVLCAFVIAGLVWLAIGWAVMRSGAPERPVRQAGAAGAQRNAAKASAIPAAI